MDNIPKRSTGRPFKHGHAGGPGAKPVPQDLKEARALNVIESERVINKFLHMPLKDMVLFLKDNTNTVHEMLIARILIEAIKEGDHKRLEWIYERLLGKLKVDIDVNVVNHDVMLTRWRELNPQDHMELIRSLKTVASTNEE